MNDSPLIAIDNHKEEAFQVTWDMSPRCNYDCSYCPPARHDNFSKHPSLEELRHTFNGISKYFQTLNAYVRHEQTLFISMTGGEPTNNPALLPFLEEVRSKHSDVYLGITTNGTFSEKYCQQLIDNRISCTISYHCESDPKLKKKVVDRIYQLQQGKRKASCNLMFHMDYFDECVNLANQFIRDGIVFTPRLIGEPGTKGLPYAHTYTEEQMAVFKNFWKKKKQLITEEKIVQQQLKRSSALSTKTKQKLITAQGEIKVPEVENSKTEDTNKKETPKVKKTLTHQNLGRPCCGGRIFCSQNKDGTRTDSTFVKDTNFQGWKCMVNWHWLHIEQHTDKIFHHQTCQATFNTNRGNIGYISKFSELIDKLQKQLDTGTMPVIVCSKRNCGCGLCLSKAKEDVDIKKLFAKTTQGLTPLIGEKLY
jgi:organic radical activating enzyme